MGTHTAQRCPNLYCGQTLCARLLDLGEGRLAQPLTDGCLQRADCEHPIAIGCLRRWSDAAMLRLTRMVATSVATQALIPDGTGRV
jgi:hypothetical protein